MNRKPQIGRTCTEYPASSAQGCQDGETQGKTKTLSQTRGDRETTKALGWILQQKEAINGKK